MAVELRKECRRIVAVELKRMLNEALRGKCHELYRSSFVLIRSAMNLYRLSPRFVISADIRFIVRTIDGLLS